MLPEAVVDSTPECVKQIRLLHEARDVPVALSAVDLPCSKVGVVRVVGPTQEVVYVRDALLG